MVASTLGLGKELASFGPNVAANVLPDRNISHCDCQRASVLTPRVEKRLTKLSVHGSGINAWNLPAPSPSQMDVINLDNCYHISPLQVAKSSLEQTADIAHIDVYISLIKESKETKSFKSAMLVHCRLCAAGLDNLETPGNQLVLMYAECGSISCAQQAFNKITTRTEHAWTFLIQGYITCGEPDSALSIFQKMQQDSSVIPSKFTYVSALKACARIKRLGNGQIIHAEVVAKGIEDDCFIGNMLVDMYTKSCSDLEAAECFHRLPVKDAVSWNAFLGGFAEVGRDEEIIELSEQMNQDGVSSDAITYACIIKACRNTGAVSKGLQIHFDVVMHSFETDEFVCSSLVDMYAQHNLLLEARDVFDVLPYRDAVAWTALIGGYVECGFAEDALKCLEQMHLEGITPDAVTFSLFLKACNITQDRDHAFELHNSILRNGFDGDSFVKNSLIASYFSCGEVEGAMAVFDKPPKRDVTSWNTVIAAYIDHGEAEDALKCWSQMREAESLPDEVTFVSILKACGLMKALHSGREIHEILVEEGFEKDLPVANVLMDMYIKCESFVDAQEVFEEMLSKNVVSWTTLISGFMENGLSMQALTCLQNMQQDGVLPNNVTYVCSLKACSNEGEIIKGQVLHTQIVSRGFDEEVQIANVLINMYANLGFIVESQYLFDRQQRSDVVSWNALISGYTQCGLHEDAINCFEQMLLKGVPPDGVTWNTLLGVYAEQGDYENTLHSYHQMQEHGFLPDAVTYIGICKTCGLAGAFDAGQRTHARLYQLDCFSSVVPMVVIDIRMAVIDMYGKCGNAVAVQELLDTVLSKDAAAWNAFLAIYARQGDYEVAIAWFETMLEKHIKPDWFTVLNILLVCSHAGRVQKGQLYYAEFCKHIGFSANREHHNALLDLHGRAGQINEAFAILHLWLFEPNLVSLNTGQHSLQKWSDVELGVHAFDWILASRKDRFPTFFYM